MRDGFPLNFDKLPTRLAGLAWTRALRDPKGEHQLWVFVAERIRKSDSFKTKNNAQTLPKQLRKSLKKSRKRLFRPLKWPKITPQIG